jgi:hypothetical protein
MTNPTLDTRSHNHYVKGLLSRTVTLPKQRGPAEMAKVRSEAQLNVKLTDKHLYAALKNVTEIQDQQQVEDSQANIPKVAPSLHHQDKHANTVPNTADNNDAPNDPFPEESQQVDLMSRFPLALSQKKTRTTSCTSCEGTHVTSSVNTRQTPSGLTGIRTMKITAWQLDAWSSRDQRG